MPQKSNSVRVSSVFVKFFIPAAALVLAGCQNMAGHSPYEYRFAENPNRKVCVSVAPYANESLRLTVLQTLKEQGFNPREVRTFDADCSRCLQFDFKTGGWSDRIVEGKLSYTRLVHGNRYEAQAVEHLPEATFGTPGDDEKVLIRALLGRIFPHPVPWKE